MQCSDESWQKIIADQRRFSDMLIQSWRTGEDNDEQPIEQQHVGEDGPRSAEVRGADRGLSTEADPDPEG